LFVSPYTEAEIARGYSINRKLVVLAYLTEIIIASLSLVGAAIFAETYGHHDWMLMTMMMLTPIAFSVVEISRVPLALAACAHRSLAIRTLAALGVLLAAGVTIKSLSQLGEIMFRPRLADVMHAKQHLDDVNAALNMSIRNIDAADAMIAQRIAELRQAQGVEAQATEKLAALPKQDCGKISGTTRDGRSYQSVKCNPDVRIPALTQALEVAKGVRVTAETALAKARSERAPLDRTAGDKLVATAEAEYHEAVMNSQLHSFTAMVFGKNPTDVTDAEIHRFLRIFVFVPAICAAFAATLISIAAVTRIKPAPSAALPVDATEYVLGPVVEHIITEALGRTLADVRQTTTTTLEG
jgi:hypothetical protein